MMKSPIGFLLCVTLGFLQQGVLAKWLMNMEVFESCPGYKNATFIYNNSRMFMKDDQLHAHYDIHISKDYSSNIESAWTFEKCQSKENPNSCMSFYTFKSGKTCDIINNSDKEIWASFVNCVTPKFGCPIKKGVYRARGCTLDISGLTMIPVDSGYWKVQIVMTDLRRRSNVACLRIEGEIRKKY